MVRALLRASTHYLSSLRPGRVLVSSPRYLQCRREDSANSCASKHKRRASGCPHEMEPDMISASVCERVVRDFFVGPVTAPTSNTGSYRPRRECGSQLGMH